MIDMFLVRNAYRMDACPWRVRYCCHWSGTLEDRSIFRTHVAPCKKHYAGEPDDVEKIAGPNIGFDPFANYTSDGYYRQFRDWGYLIYGLQISEKSLCLLLSNPQQTKWCHPVTELLYVSYVVIS